MGVRNPVHPAHAPFLRDELPPTPPAAASPTSPAFTNEQQWKQVALVFDRILLIVFFVAMTVCSVYILTSSPHLYTAPPEDDFGAAEGKACIASNRSVEDFPARPPEEPLSEFVKRLKEELSLNGDDNEQHD